MATQQPPGGPGTRRGGVDIAAVAAVDQLAKKRAKAVEGRAGRGGGGSEIVTAVVVVAVVIVILGIMIATAR